MFKRIIAVAAAAVMALSLVACKSGPKASATNTAAANLGGKAYTQQTFDGAMMTGVLTPAIDSAGELVTVSQDSGKAAVVTTWDVQGKKKNTVTSDVTDTVSRFALSAKDEVYLLAAPTGGLETVHVLGTDGKTAQTIALAGMKVQTRQTGANAATGTGSSAAPSATASDTAAPAATAAPAVSSASGRNGGPGGFGGGNFNMRNNITAMQVAPDGSVLVAAMNSGVLQFDSTGKQVRTIGDQNLTSYLAMNEKNQLLVYSTGAGGGFGGGAGGASSTPTLKTFDTTNGSQVSSMDVAGATNLQSIFYDKAGKRLLFMTDSDVRVLSADGKTSSVLATYSDFSLLNGSRELTSFAIDSTGTIYLEAYNSDASTGTTTTGTPAAAGGFGGGFAAGAGGGNLTIFGVTSSANEVIRLGLVDASTIKARKTITMAVLNSNRILTQAISAFQIANPDYLIQLKVYNTQVQGFRQGASQFDVSTLVQSFNTDLMSGQGADIIVLDSLPWYKYIDKGLLVDMGQLMTTKKVDTTQYFTNIFDACKVGGKLYGIPMSFSYSVLTGKASTMPDSATPTMADFIAKAKALPQGITAFAKQDAMQIFLSYMRYSYADLVNTTSHKATFDSPEFIQTMKDFKDLIGTNTSTDNNQNFQAQQLDGTVAYNIASMTNPESLAMQRAILGDDLKTVNVPTLSGSGSGAFTASLMLGINANSSNQDVAWKFIESMLGTDIQASGRLTGYPVLKSAAKTMIDNMKSGTALNAGGRRMVLQIGDKQVEIKPLTDADYQGITDTLPKLNSLQAVDPNIQQVLTEELPAFFAGTKSAEDTAAAIQNRVNTILNE